MATRKNRYFLYGIFDFIYFLLMIIITTWLFAHDSKFAYNIVKNFEETLSTNWFLNEIDLESTEFLENSRIAGLNKIGITGCIIVFSYAPFSFFALFIIKICNKYESLRETAHKSGWRPDTFYYVGFITTMISLLYGFQDVDTDPAAANRSASIALLVGKAGTALFSTVTGIILKRLSEGFFYTDDTSTSTTVSADLDAHLDALEDALKANAESLSESRDVQNAANTTLKEQNQLLEAQTSTLHAMNNGLSDLVHQLKTTPPPQRGSITTATIDLAPVLTSLSTLNGIAASINGNLSSLVGYAHSLNDTLTSADSRINLNTEAVRRIADKVDTLSTGLSGLRKQFSALENLTPSLFDKLDQCSARLRRFEVMLRSIARGMHVPNSAPIENKPVAGEQGHEENNVPIGGRETSTEADRQFDWPPGLPYRRYFDPLGDEVSAMAAYCARQGVTARRSGDAST